MNVSELLISQVVTQFFILVVQIVLMLVFVLFVFKVSMYDINTAEYIYIYIYIAGIFPFFCLFLVVILNRC